eukprot:CAMPEP_0118672270 /NCGR_PEP_ID=MMETSP0785-20121206/22448_1 /TAXON_ID=91992 /ORGANISM="Bolidomonas pacifica, Strain CCMP 1866" /LENGTH=299 /DNA_ID=CAMNT_0006567215 /DNA_START=164 /DNA_END=1064 /DNA_ORIENTATION=+
MTNCVATFKSINDKSFNYPPNRYKAILSLFKHADHIKTNLTSTRRTLINMIKSFQTLTTTVTSLISTTNTQSNNLRMSDYNKIIQLWFKAYLRVKDAFVFTESGECRHKKDKENASSKLNHYKSNLTRCGMQGDGYTKYWKGSHYSGYGWDEYYGSVVGLRSRLSHFMGSENRVEKVMSRSDFNAMMDLHEVEYKESGDRMKWIVERFKRDVEDGFGMEDGKRVGRVWIKEEDKQESMVVEVNNSVKGYMKLSLQRLGSNYKLPENEGVMGNGEDEDWDKKWVMEDCVGGGETKYEEEG